MRVFCSVGVMDTEIARMAVMKSVMLQTVATNFQCASCAKQEMIMAVMLKLESLSVFLFFIFFFFIIMISANTSNGSTKIANS